MRSSRDITASCDVSRLEVEGPMFDTRIQGGVLADGLNGALACLCTITPVSTFAQVRIVPIQTQELFVVLTCSEQWCHRPHQMRQPQSRILLLLLPDYHGHLLQICCCACRHPGFRFGRDDYISILGSCCIRYSHHLHHPLYPAEPLRPHRSDGSRVRRYVGAKLVPLRVYV